MKIRAIGFDIGGTLVNYNKPLSWSSSYKDALQFMCSKNNIKFSEDRYKIAKEILEKYNTRLNPREIEVTSDDIFNEIFTKWNETFKTNAKKSFYFFFQREANLYDDTKMLLEFCKENNIKCAVYTDVAYGMDDEISLNDIKEIENYFDLKLTSRNVGYRKPNKKGFEIMIEKFLCNPNEMLYIGDEEKDIIGAKSVNIKSVLINRSDEQKDFNQDYTVKNLNQVIELIKK